MDKQLLNTLNKGEKLVEMTEITLHDETVIKTILYTCVGVNIFNKWKIETYEFPFYFETKELAEEFLKYWDELRICKTIYWNNIDKPCFGLYISGQENMPYIMVDSWRNDVFTVDPKNQLSKNGIWGGQVIKYVNGQHFTFKGDCFDYKKIFALENVGKNTNKTYIFKMVRDWNF